VSTGVNKVSSSHISSCSDSSLLLVTKYVYHTFVTLSEGMDTYLG